jgi:hypothetical protein
MLRVDADARDVRDPPSGGPDEIGTSLPLVSRRPSSVLSTPSDFGGRSSEWEHAERFPREHEFEFAARRAQSCRKPLPSRRAFVADHALPQNAARNRTLQAVTEVPFG